MGHYEDNFMSIYNEVELKGLRKKFDSQLKKMRTQSKHDHKEQIDLWEYALRRIKGWAPNKSEKKQ